MGPTSRNDKRDEDDAEAAEERWERENTPDEYYRDPEDSELPDPSW